MLRQQIHCSCALAHTHYAVAVAHEGRWQTSSSFHVGVEEKIPIALLSTWQSLKPFSVSFLGTKEVLSDKGEKTLKGAK